jgi:hypothetical protein
MGFLKKLFREANRIVKQTVHVVDNVAHGAEKHLLRPVVHAVDNVAHAAEKHIVRPVAHGIGDAVKETGKGIAKLCNAVGQSGVMGTRVGKNGKPTYRLLGIKIGRDGAKLFKTAQITAAVIVAGPIGGAVQSAIIAGQDGANADRMLKCAAMSLSNSYLGPIATAVVFDTDIGDAAITTVCNAIAQVADIEYADIVMKVFEKVLIAAKNGDKIENAALNGLAEAIIVRAVYELFDSSYSEEDSSDEDDRKSESKDEEHKSVPPPNEEHKSIESNDNIFKMPLPSKAEKEIMDKFVKDTTDANYNAKDANIISNVLPQMALSLFTTCKNTINNVVNDTTGKIVDSVKSIKEWYKDRRTSKDTVLDKNDVIVRMQHARRPLRKGDDGEHLPMASVIAHSGIVGETQNGDQYMFEYMNDKTVHITKLNKENYQIKETHEYHNVAVIKTDAKAETWTVQKYGCQSNVDEQSLTYSMMRMFYNIAISNCHMSVNDAKNDHCIKGDTSPFNP